MGTLKTGIEVNRDRQNGKLFDILDPTGQGSKYLAVKVYSSSRKGKNDLEGDSAISRSATPTQHLECTGLELEKGKAVTCSMAEPVSPLLSASQAATFQCLRDKAAAQSCGGGTSA